MTTLLDTHRPRLLLTLLCLLLWMPGFFSIPPSDRDESRFVQATKQMLETGDFVRIMNGQEARNRKPIGIHWLQAPFVAAAHGLGLATDNPVWPYRVPSALGGLLAVLASYELGQRLLDRRAALLGAGMLASSVLLVVEVHIAKTDAALVGATTVAMAVLGRAYLDPSGLDRRAAATFWLAMGIGVLLKGPITPMVAGLTVVTLLVIDRRTAHAAQWLRSLRAGWGMPLMLAVVLPWFVAIGAATGGRFFTEAVGGDLGRKLTSGDDAHWGPPGLHLLMLPVLLFPTIAALPGGVAAAWRERRTPLVRFLLAWIVPAWLVFEATPTKLPHYTLPLYPAVCLLLAHGVVSGVPLRGWRWLGSGLAAFVAVLLAGVAVAAPVLLGLDPWLGAPAVVAALVVGWQAVRGCLKHDWQPPGLAARGVAASLAAMVLLYGAVLGWELPALWPLWIAPRVVASVPGLASGASAPGLASSERLGAVGYSEPSLMFLAGTGTQFLLPGDGITALADGSVDVLLVDDRDLAAVRAGLLTRGAATRLVGVVPGFNYSRGRRVTLTMLAR